MVAEELENVLAGEDAQVTVPRPPDDQLVRDLEHLRRLRRREHDRGEQRFLGLRAGRRGFLAHAASFPGDPGAVP